MHLILVLILFTCLISKTDPSPIKRFDSHLSYTDESETKQKEKDEVDSFEVKFWKNRRVGMPAGDNGDDDDDDDDEYLHDYSDSRRDFVNQIEDQNRYDKQFVEKPHFKRERKNRRQLRRNKARTSKGVNNSEKNDEDDDDDDDDDDEEEEQQKNEEEYVRGSYENRVHPKDIRIRPNEKDKFKDYDYRLDNLDNEYNKYTGDVHTYVYTEATYDNNDDYANNHNSDHDEYLRFNKDDLDFHFDYEGQFDGFVQPVVEGFHERNNKKMDRADDNREDDEDGEEENDGRGESKRHPKDVRIYRHDYGKVGKDEYDHESDDDNDDNDDDEADEGNDKKKRLDDFRVRFPNVAVEGDENDDNDDDDEPIDDKHSNDVNDDDDDDDDDTSDANNDDHFKGNSEHERGETRKHSEDHRTKDVREKIDDSDYLDENIELYRYGPHNVMTDIWREEKDHEREGESNRHTQRKASNQSDKGHDDDVDVDDDDYDDDKENGKHTGTNDEKNKDDHHDDDDDDDHDDDDGDDDDDNDDDNNTDKDDDDDGDDEGDGGGDDEREEDDDYDSDYDDNDDESDDHEKNEDDDDEDDDDDAEKEHAGQEIVI